MNSDPVIAALHRQQRLYDAFVSAIDTRKGAAAAMPITLRSMSC